MNVVSLLLMGLFTCSMHASFQTVTVEPNGKPRSTAKRFNETYEALLSEIPTFETERLVVRPVEYSDMAPVAKLVTDPDVIKLNTGFFTQHATNVSQTIQNIIKSPIQSGSIWWMVYDKERGYIGLIGLNRIDQTSKSAELIGLSASTHWGRGYGTEAAQLVIEYGFKTLELVRIEAIVSAYNKGSLRLLEKIGMKQEGCMRKSGCYDGTLYDEYICSIIIDDIQI